MILRIWHGYTIKTKAALYEELLKTEILPEIEGKKVQGHHKTQMLRRTLEDEIEFTVMMWFTSIASVQEFVGADYEAVYVPEKAKQVLSHYDHKAVHLELRETLDHNKP